MSELTPCLWFFADDALDAMTRYVEVFSRYGAARVTDVTHFGEGGMRPAGTVLTVEAELDGQRVVAINGGPAGFAHSPAFSMMVLCEGAEQVDHYWDSLVQGGEPSQCGWLVDRWGISWQVVPRELRTWMADPDASKAAAVDGDAADAEDRPRRPPRRLRHRLTTRESVVRAAPVSR